MGPSLKKLNTTDASTLCSDGPCSCATRIPQFCCPYTHFHTHPDARSGRAGRWDKKQEGGEGVANNHPWLGRRKRRGTTTSCPFTYQKSVCSLSPSCMPHPSETKRSNVCHAEVQKTGGMSLEIQDVKGKEGKRVGSRLLFPAYLVLCKHQMAREKQFGAVEVFPSPAALQGQGSCRHHPNSLLACSQQVDQNALGHIGPRHSQSWPWSHSIRPF